SCNEAIQFLLRGLLDCFASLAMTGRGRRKPLPVIARSSCDEAIQFLLRGLLDCFASLAMTARGRRKSHAVIARCASFATTARGERKPRRALLSGLRAASARLFPAASG